MPDYNTSQYEFSDKIGCGVSGPGCTYFTISIRRHLEREVQNNGIWVGIGYRENPAFELPSYASNRKDNPVIFYPFGKD